VKVSRVDIFKLTITYQSSHEISNDNGVKTVNFATSKNLVARRTMFPHCNINKYTWTSPEGKTHNQTDHVLIDTKWLSSIIDVQFFRWADCDTDYYMAVAKVREIVAVTNKLHTRWIWRDSVSRS
jgi:hypothetical protein